MFSRSAFSTLFLSIALVALADVTPTDPSPGQVFQAGAACAIAWNPDTTGTWKTLNIELMTGDNNNMIHLTTVGTVDGTASPGTFSFPCPAVTPAAPIYFYQFSSPAATDKQWTGRFTITSVAGQTVPAPNQVQPDGQAIPWGTGALVDPSKAVPAPSYLNGGNPTSPTGNTTIANATPAVPTSNTMVVKSSAVLPGATTPATPQFASASDSTPGTAADSAAGASGTGSSRSSSSSSNSGGALVLGTVSARAAQAGVALAAIAGTFMFMM